MAAGAELTIPQGLDRPPLSGRGGESAVQPVAHHSNDKPGHLHSASELHRGSVPHRLLIGTVA